MEVLAHFFCVVYPTNAANPRRVANTSKNEELFIWREIGHLLSDEKQETVYLYTRYLSRIFSAYHGRPWVAGRHHAFFCRSRQVLCDFHDGHHSPCLDILGDRRDFSCLCRLLSGDHDPDHGPCLVPVPYPYLYLCPCPRHLDQLAATYVPLALDPSLLDFPIHSAK